MDDHHKVENRRHAESGKVHPMALALVYFLAGVLAGALWLAPKVKIPANVAVQTEQAPAADPAPAVAENPTPGPVSPIPPDPAALEAIKHSIPNITSTSVEEGSRILRDAAVIEFQRTVRELQAKQKKLEQSFVQGQKDKSPEEQQIATKQLRELQAEQMDKLQQLAARSKAQIDLFQQLKAGGP